MGFAISDFIKSGVAKGSKLDLTISMNPMAGSEQKICYVHSLNDDYLAVVSTAHEIRSGETRTFSSVSYDSIRAYRILKKELGPVTKKELKECLVDVGSKLEATLSEDSRIIGFVKEIGRDYISLTPGWSDKSKAPYRCSDGGIPSIQLKFRIIKSYELLEY